MGSIGAFAAQSFDAALAVGVSCAHELGHHIFGDGSRVDELFDPTSKKERSDEEVRADMFAGMLLMPKSAVDRAFSLRKLSPETANPVEFSRVACALGVGYSTLAGHLYYALCAITEERLFEVLPPDPQRLDHDGDGIGCEPIGSS